MRTRYSQVKKVSLIKKEVFALKLLDIQAIKFGKFRLKLHEKNPNAPLSPIYIDLRIIRSYPEVLDIAIKVYRYLINTLSFDLLADVPTAATPFVAILAHKLKIPMITPRIEKKTHGALGQLNGVFTKGQVAILIDDLITKADSKLEAISILNENGLIVKDVVVLIDREQGGVIELEKLGFSCHYAFKLKEILEFYLEKKRISQNHYDEVMNYLEEPMP